MRFPIDAKTGKPYGMPKGVKPQEEKPAEVDEAHKQRAAGASPDAATRDKTFKPDSKS